MARTIEFDAQALIGKIDALRGAQLPYAGNQALWALKPKLNAELQKEMQRKFKNPVPFTLSSPRFRIDGLEMTVGISKKGDKGQDPARYLYPVTTPQAGSYPAKAAPYHRRVPAALVQTAPQHAAQPPAHRTPRPTSQPHQPCKPRLPGAPACVTTQPT